MTPGYTRTTVLMIAAIAGLATTTLICMWFYTSKPRERNVAVVVAAQDISAHTVVSPRMVRVITLPESRLLSDAATRPVDVNQRVTMAPVRKGEQFVLTSLSDKGTAFGLAGIIPPGTRAMTITVDAADAVSGFVQPGDHVDVIATVTDGADSIARTILQNVILLAVNASLRPASVESAGNQTSPAGQKGLAQGQTPEATTTRVTVAVSPSEAERLVVAQFKGKLKIGLRGLDDSSRYATGGASVNAMFGIKPPQTGLATITEKPTKAARHYPSAPGPSKLTGLPPITPFLEEQPRKIRVIKGTQVQEVEVAH
jgi:pilus assembly protein CpaB